MPIYEYRCPDCDHQFDELQKISDDPISVCPECAAENVKKLISRSSFSLKGGGWYSDHYGLKSSGGAASGGASAGGAASGKGSASSSSDSGSTPAPAPAPASPSSSSD